MESYYVQSPVLFVVFNRPDTTRQVFERIRAAKPSRLYIAADGPREGRPDEAERSRKVRELAKQVDWDCEVKTLFSETNKGCRLGPVSAITWFFDHEPEGIILEDDCVPGWSFSVFVTKCWNVTVTIPVFIPFQVPINKWAAYGAMRIITTPGWGISGVGLLAEGMAAV